MEKILTPFVRSEYNYDRMAASDASALRCEDKSLTVQSEVEETDINTIVRRFGVTGTLPISMKAPSYADFTGVYDFQSAMNAVAAAHEAFDQLDADVRYRFSNDPAKFIDFCDDPGNRDEAIKLGLIFPKNEVPADLAPDENLDSTPLT